MNIEIDKKTAYGFRFMAYDERRHYIGQIKVGVFPEFVRVTESHVDPELRRRGFGTKLYEAAAHFACSEYGVPLASDTIRSRAAEHFWRKQLRKKRARCVGRGGKHREPSMFMPFAFWRCGMYSLRCPAPRTLARSR